MKSSSRIPGVIPSTIAFVATVYGARAAIAVQPQNDAAVIGTIVAAWKERHKQIRTLTCSAKVESFYPKGYLTEYLAREYPERRKDPPSPEQDKRFVDEKSTWAIDFGAQKIKKEYEVTNPFFYPPNSAELAVDYSLKLFSEGKYRFFRPKHRYPRKARETALAPDVQLFEGGSHAFVLDFRDLPLLWLAGGVSGQHPLPLEMQRLEKPDHFSSRGRGEKAGHKCIVLTVQEQDDNTSVREFWVGLESPYPIHCCRMRAGDRLYWQIDAEYRKHDAHLVPARWSFVAYSPAPLFSKRTFSVENLQINVPLPLASFEKALEPGMLAFHAPKNQPFDVDSDGELVPLGTAGSAGWIRTWIVIAAALVAVMVGIFLVRRVTRRASS